MSRFAIESWFYFTLFGGLPLGIVLAVLWAKKIMPRLLKLVNRQAEKTGVISISGISMQSFFFMIPGLILLIACCVPVLYFGNLRKQREYCLKVLEVNKGITKESRFLQERCGCFDLDELFAEHAAGKE